MGKISVETTNIEGLKVITPQVFGDERGYFMETYNYQDMQQAGLNMQFVQDNQSMSVKGVLRGLHFQKEFPQGKLVRVIKGRVFDVAVDMVEQCPALKKRIKPITAICCKMFNRLKARIRQDPRTQFGLFLQCRKS